MINILRIFMLFGILFIVTNCGNIEEELNDGISSAEVDAIDVDALFVDIYRSLEIFQTQDNIWALQQHTTDELMGPTRGTDWDDNGIWRVLHDHTWDAEHNYIRTAFNSMGRGFFISNDILQYDLTPEQEAVARFIRAFYVHHINDNWGQVPMREPGADIVGVDPTVMGSQEASDFVINEVEAVINDLPNSDPATAYIASKESAYALLAKAYLNRAVYNSADRVSLSFSSGDMDKVITYCDQIITSGKYSVDDDFYDNFRPQNDVVSSELVFTSQNTGGLQAGNVRSRWFFTLHYNQNPSGWNGFCTISDFYNKFTDDNDIRKSAEPDDLTPVSGLKAGFLVGQQKNELGEDLEDRRGNPLAFTPEVALFETGDNLEVTGVRAIKYIPDYTSGDLSDNDYVFYRYSDILLMKAEAIARGGSATNGDSPASLVNMIRGKRGVPENSDGSLDAIYDERGFELWWEGHRRQDQIRFGTFLDAWDEKNASDPTKVLFPIPAVELAASPNLVQNPGY